MRSVPDRAAARTADRPAAPSRVDPFDPYGGDDLPQSSMLDWHQHLIVLRRRMWPALTVFVIVLVAGAIHGFTRVPVYQAKARLLIDRVSANVTGLKDPLEQDPSGDTDFQTQLTIFKSRSLARRSLQALGQLDQSVATGSAPVAPPAAAPAGRQAPEKPGESAKIDAFLAGIGVTPVASSRLVDITYTNVDPQVTAAYANALAEQYVQQNLELKSAASRDVVDWLGDRLVEQRKALEASDRSLQNYREHNAVVATKEQATILIQKLSDLTTAYTKVKTDRIGKEASYTQIEALRRERQPLDSSAAILANPTVQQIKSELTTLQNRQAQLAQTFGEKYPPFAQAREAVQVAQARLQAEINKSAEAVKQDFLAAKDAEGKLGEALETQKRESLALNRTDVEFAVLQRDAESNRQIYDSLLQRVNEFSVTRERRGNNIRIVDVAEVPQRPIGSGAWSDLRYGALGGLVLALCVAFGLELVDNRIKNPQQVKEMGTALLGLVPLVETGGTKAKTALAPLLSRTTSPGFNEAFRGLRTNVRLSIATDGMRTVLVTSACAGDGKTLVASNLAVALALADQRVMLIDADLRRPRLHTVFGVPQKRGLTDLLVGQAVASETIRRTEVPNLHLLTAGTTPPNPSELLESLRFSEFLTHLEKYFDWVILDSPPVMPVTDAIVLCEKVDGVVLVASAEKTPLPALRGALDQIRRARASVLGIVLNQVDVQRRGYYYAGYYHRDYEQYYVGSAAQD